MCDTEESTIIHVVKNVGLDDDDHKMGKGFQVWLRGIHRRNVRRYLLETVLRPLSKAIGARSSSIEKFSSIYLVSLSIPLRIRLGTGYGSWGLSLTLGMPALMKNTIETH